MPALRVTARDLDVAALLEEMPGWPIGLVRFGRSSKLDTGGRGGALMGVNIWQYFRGANASLGRFEYSPPMANSQR